MSRKTARALVITSENKICLIKRNKRGDEYWVVPGGGIDENETPKQAVVRELEEEIGAQFLEEECFFAFDYVSDNQDYSTQFPVFFCRETRPRTIPQGEEHTSKSSSDNTYEVVDVAIDELNNINLVPEGIRTKIIDYLNKSGALSYK